MAEVKPIILVVDDELSIRESFSLILGKEFTVVTAASGEAALKRIIDERIDLVYLDVRMPGMSGIETLKKIKEIDKNIEVILVTAVNDVGSASSAVKLGAKDYLVKPFNVHDIINMTRSFVIKAQTRAIRPPDGEEIIGNSKQVLNVKRSVEYACQNNSSILIIGEKGLEAEQIARIVSGETEKKLLILNAVSNLSSSALFGCEKGSFASEFGKVAGLLEKAESGILFIRNVELLPKEIQSSLGQAMSKKEFSRDGSPAMIPMDVRVIAETSAKLNELVSEGKFDETLFNAISEITIDLPPLKMRESDLPLLIDHYLEKFANKYDKKIKISPQSVEVLAACAWPGNLAELSNSIESIILSLESEVLEPEDLPLDVLIKSPSGGRPFTSFETIEESFEKAHILNIYRRAGENKEKAAAMLGMQVKNLESKLGSF
jgi:DNA-binding NtrC family response regulator